ncbi:MAG: hypothetical protein ACXWQO_01760 [Bdellovibrionota bacterium]
MKHLFSALALLALYSCAHSDKITPSAPGQQLAETTPAMGSATKYMLFAQQEIPALEATKKAVLEDYKNTCKDEPDDHSLMNCFYKHCFTSPFQTASYLPLYTAMLSELREDEEKTTGEKNYSIYRFTDLLLESMKSFDKPRRFLNSAELKDADPKELEKISAMEEQEYQDFKASIQSMNRKNLKKLKKHHGSKEPGFARKVKISDIDALIKKNEAL